MEILNHSTIKTNRAVVCLSLFLSLSKLSLCVCVSCNLLKSASPKRARAGGNTNRPLERSLVVVGAFGYPSGNSSRSNASKCS